MLTLDIDCISSIMAPARATRSNNARAKTRTNTLTKCSGIKKRGQGCQQPPQVDTEGIALAYCKAPFTRTPRPTSHLTQVPRPISNETPPKRTCEGTTATGNACHRLGKSISSALPAYCHSTLIGNIALRSAIFWCRRGWKPVR